MFHSSFPPEKALLFIHNNVSDHEHNMEIAGKKMEREIPFSAIGVFQASTCPASDARSAGSARVNTDPSP